MNASINNLSYRRTANSGFTLVELMVTVVVLGIIVSMAAPNISNQLANQRVKSTTATLTNALKEAKVESVIRRKSVTVSYDKKGTESGVIDIKVEVPGPGSGPAQALYFSKPPASGGNETGGNETGGNETGGNETGGNETGGNETGGNETGGNETGGNETGGNETGGNETGGNETDTGVIPAPVPTPNFGIIATYQYDAKSRIQPTPGTITFKADKRVDAAATYTICDSNTSASPRQVTISATGLIGSKLGGACK